jgi:hypothetical protein
MAAEPDPVDDDPPSIPERSWQNPFAEETYLNQLFGQIVRDERDVIIILDDYRGRRGTGKTVGSLKLAEALTLSDHGVTLESVSLDVEEIREAYYKLPKRTAIVMDEAEIGASNRQAMTKTNQALREIMSMGRVEQKYVIINAPLKGFIDKDLQKLADVWISMTRKGRALVHQYKWEPYSERLMTPKRQWLNFQDIPTGTDLRDVYNYLTREKRKRIRGGEGGGYIERAEHQEKLEKVRKEVAKTEREEIVFNVYTHPVIRENEIPQWVIAEAADVSQKTVSNIVRRMEEERDK